jgi:hypothetical protein
LYSCEEEEDILPSWRRESEDWMTVLQAKQKTMEILLGRGVEVWTGVDLAAPGSDHVACRIDLVSTPIVAHTRRLSAHWVREDQQELHVDAHPDVEDCLEMSIEGLKLIQDRIRICNDVPDGIEKFMDTVLKHKAFERRYEKFVHYVRVGLITFGICVPILVILKAIVISI